MLIIPDNNPTKAKVCRTALGNALVDCLLSIPSFHPEVQVLHFCLMPDHLHAVLYVRRTMPKGIGALVRGFWQAAKKLGRAHTAAPFIKPNDIWQNFQEEMTRQNFQEEMTRQNNQEETIQQNNQEEHARRRRLKEETKRLEVFSATLSEEMGDEAYYRLAPVFTEMPFIRPMGHNTQLPNTIRYIDMNPQRLATKRLKPGFFRVQHEIKIGGRSYDGVGNTTLLMAEHFETVHVRRAMVEEICNQVAL